MAKVASDSSLISVKDFTKWIVSNSDEPISGKAAERIARDALIDRRLITENLAQSYGRKIILDATAISLVVEERSTSLSGRPEIVVLALVLDQASGLILGAEVATEKNAVRAQYAALVMADRLLNERRVDALWEDPVHFHATIGPAADDHFSQFCEGMKRLIGKGNVKSRGPGRFGRQTKEVLGPRLGPLMLLPRSTESGNVKAAGSRAIGQEAMSTRKAKEAIASIVDEHNRPILDKLQYSQVLSREETGKHGASIGMTLKSLIYDAQLNPS